MAVRMLTRCEPEWLVERRISSAIPASHFGRRDLELDVDTSLGRPCVRLRLALDFRGSKPPRGHRGERYWCPAALAEDGAVARLGWFQLYFVDHPPSDIAPDVMPMLRSLEFTPGPAQGAWNPPK